MKVHRYWEGEKSGLNNWTGKALRHLGHDVDTWNYLTLPPECREWVDSVTDLVIPRQRLRHRANCVRWWMLAEYGGWWADYDLVPFRHFDTLPFPATASHSGVRCTSWLAFPAGHEVPLTMMAAISAGEGVGNSPEQSGEALLESLCPPEIASVPLPINSGGYPEGEPWAVHLYSNSNIVR